MQSAIGIVYSSNKRRQKVLQRILSAFSDADVDIDLFSLSANYGPIIHQIDECGV
jgi:hypothetical protein